jgi:hypothetical protein
MSFYVRSSSSFRPSGSQQQCNSGSQQQYNSGSEQSDQIMNILNAILEKQRTLEQSFQRMLNSSVQLTPRLQQTTPNFTYEMFTDYLITRLAPQLEERARSLAPVLLELRYFYSIIITPINDRIRLTYTLDLFVRWLKTTMGFLASSISVS